MNPAVDMGGYRVTENASLASRNTLRVDVRADWLLELTDAARLPDVLALPAITSTPLLVLGEGSNILFADDFHGAVLAMATRGVHVEEDGDVARIAVAAGERWDDFVRWSLSQGFAGLENLILIPGTVGAAPIQNIGAYGVEVAEFIEAVEAWDRTTRKVVSLDRTACAFAYRDSLFKREPDRYIVTAVRFALPRKRELRLDYAGIGDQLKRMGIVTPTPFHVAEAVVHLRTRKLPDPAVIGNAGSFFKNPQVDTETAAALKRDHPDMPQWPIADDAVKLSAAWLIESCGFKGLREEDAGISNRHALVLVNHGRARGDQLWALAQKVRRGVEERFGILLHPEPKVIGASIDT
ncbi:UDP-N-acetylmuramate dehydrogenase [Oleiagrimonas citrea]